MLRSRESRIVRHLPVGARLALAAALTAPAVVMAQAEPFNHSAHHPATAPSEASLADQVAELRAKVAQLDSELQQKQRWTGGSGMTPGMRGMSGANQVGRGMGGGRSGMGPMMGRMPSGSQSTGGATAAGTGTTQAPMGNDMGEMGSMGGGGGGMAGGGMSGGAGGGMGGTGGMESEMGMGSGGMGAGTQGMTGGNQMQGGMGGGMGAMQEPMESDTAEMASMSMGGGGMGGTGAMEPGTTSMMGMPPRGTGAARTAGSAALPGFPGTSRLYHAGSSGFFLDHGEQIKLSDQQRAALNAIKERAMLDRAAKERAVNGAEQQLWALTASDQPDAAKIVAKVREVEKLRGDERLNFIRAVGEAAKVLTEDQRQALANPPPPQTPTAQPASSSGMGGGGGGGMGDM